MKRFFLSLFLCGLLLTCLAGCGNGEPPEASTEEPMEEAEEITLPAPKTVVIDAGHQAQANTEQEPVGPNAAETKMKVTGGTAGVSTGVPEYELTLTISQLLRDELTTRGYQVVMVRESHDVDLSNRERADMANQSGGDIFLRIHANGSEDPSVNGAMTLCPTPQSPYPIGELYSQCRLLSDLVLEELSAVTGAEALYVWETDTMSGVNWCRIPVTIVEIGFLSNPEEDLLLNSPGYQAKIVTGIANGVDQYFARMGS